MVKMISLGVPGSFLLHLANPVLVLLPLPLAKGYMYVCNCSKAPRSIVHGVYELYCH